MRIRISTSSIIRITYLMYNALTDHGRPAAGTDLSGPGEVLGNFSGWPGIHLSPAGRGEIPSRERARQRGDVKYSIERVMNPGHSFPPGLFAYRWIDSVQHHRQVSRQDPAERILRPLF